MSEVTETITYDYECPTCGWLSVGWEDQETADARGAKHQCEHQFGQTIAELAEPEKEQD